MIAAIVGLDTRATMNTVSYTHLDVYKRQNLYCAVTRKDLHHPEASGYRPEEAFSLEAALRCMTETAAWQSFEEGRKGVIQVGALPDFTICDQDVFALAPQKLKDVRSWMTICQGKVRWQAE